MSDKIDELFGANGDRSESGRSLYGFVCANCAALAGERGFGYCGDDCGVRRFC